ncbi:MAG: SoxR reducing system RseC family protein [Spongiibacteraceae bacterium]
MIYETARVLAVESDSLWLETISSSSCGSCAAQKGCGQGLMAKYSEGKRNQLKLSLGGQASADYAVDDDVTIAIPESVLVSSALIMYFLPLLGLLLGMMAMQQFVDGDGYAALGALLGFVAGLGAVFLHGRYSRENIDLQPKIIGKKSSEPRSHDEIIFSQQSL